MKRCNFFWGSHGCDLDAGHSGPHQCGLNIECSEFETWDGTYSDAYDQIAGSVRYALYSSDDELVRWSEWRSSIGWYQ